MARNQQNKDHDRAFGARVRFARIEARISQGALGEKLGISFQQVQKYELGKDRISASQLLNIANVFEKPISFFYDDVGAQGAEADGGTLADIVDRRGRDRADSTFDVRIIRLLHRVPAEVKRHTAKMLEAIADQGQPAPAEAPAPQLQAAE